MSDNNKLMLPPSFAPLQKWEGKANVLLPCTVVEQLPVGMQLSVRVVQLDAEKDSYPIGKGLISPSRNALEKISAAAGITWLRQERTDDRSHPHYCEFEVECQVMDFDGLPRRAIGTKTVDLRDNCDGKGTPGKDRAGKDAKELAVARKFISEICCGKAQNRAIASVLAFKRAYTKEEFEKPFVVPKMVPDTSNEQVRNALLASMFGGPSPYRAERTVIDVTPKPELLPQAADDDEPAHDPETGEVAEPEMCLAPEDAKKRYNEAYREWAKTGGQPAQWRVFWKEVVGEKGSKFEDWYESDFAALNKAVADTVGGKR